MKSFTAHVLLAVCLTFFFLSGVYALEIPPLHSRVNDYAHMISPPVRQQLEAKLAELEQSDSTQIAVLTVTDLQGVTIEEYAIKVAEKWKIGQRRFNNGVIFLVAKENRKMRIEVGYGLEGKLTDILAGKILDHEVRPYFKAGNYDEGFIRGVDGIIQTVRGEYRASQAPRSHQRTYTQRSTKDIIQFIGIFILIIALIVLGAKRNFLPVIAGSLGFPLLMMIKASIDVAGFIAMAIAGALIGFILGLIGHAFKKAPSSGYDSYDNYSSSSYSSNSYSSSSNSSWSGGGGSFGGGGASSDW